MSNYLSSGVVPKSFTNIGQVCVRALTVATFSSLLFISACGGKLNHHSSEQNTSADVLGDKTLGNDINTTCQESTAAISWLAAFVALPVIEQASSMFQLPGNNNDWYVLRQPGVILRFANTSSANKSTEALNISDRVDFTKVGESGLLGVAIHPQFSTNHYVFFYYTGSSKTAGSGLETRVARYTANSDGTFDKSSELIILRIDRPYANNIGGHLAFDSKGLLYIASGDGGSAGDPHQYGQNLTSLLGKMLRIDINTTSAGRNYSIPSDNPFIDNPNARAEIWAYGLRNAWRFSFDSENGELWAGDVGQNVWEEINIVTKGGNYGWGDMEGDGCYSKRPSCDTANKIKPLYTVNHDDGICSITGGYVYRGTSVPAAYGKYFFSDFCVSTIHSITRQTNNTVNIGNHGTPASQIVSFALDNQGELFALGQGGGIGQQIYKMQTANVAKTGCVNPINKP